MAGFFEQDNWKRIDQAAVPALALREALINSICHRDYTVFNTTLMLAIYDDRLELWNAGELPKQLNIENLKNPHGSYPRNKHIANVFYKRGWIETWGTGTTRMIDFCRNNKTPEPEFNQYSGGFSIVFPFNEPMQSDLNKTNIQAHQLTERQKEIISILQKTSELSGTQIYEQVKIKIPMRTLQYELNKLKKLGILSSKGHARSFVWSLIL